MSQHLAESFGICQELVKALESRDIFCNLLWIVAEASRPQTVADIEPEREVEACAYGTRRQQEARADIFVQGPRRQG